MRAVESVVQRPIQVKFVPKLDITAYELARVCMMPDIVTFMPIAWEVLDPAVKRHFEQR